MYVSRNWGSALEYVDAMLLGTPHSLTSQKNSDHTQGKPKLPKYRFSASKPAPTKNAASSVNSGLSVLDNFEWVIVENPLWCIAYKSTAAVYFHLFCAPSCYWKKTAKLALLRSIFAIDAISPTALWHP